MRIGCFSDMKTQKIKNGSEPEILLKTLTVEIQGQSSKYSDINLSTKKRIIVSSVRAVQDAID